MAENSRGVGRQLPNCIDAGTLFDEIGTTKWLNGDKRYDGQCRARENRSAWVAFDIPPKVTRIWEKGFSRYLPKIPNAIERMLSDIEDFRRVATRNDRLAINFHAVVCTVATIDYWPRFPALTDMMLCVGS